MACFSLFLQGQWTCAQRRLIPQLRKWFLAYRSTAVAPQWGPIAFSYMPRLQVH